MKNVYNNLTKTMIFIKKRLLLWSAFSFAFFLGACQPLDNLFDLHQVPTPVADGSLLISPPDEPNLFSPDWHPDGTKLAVNTEFFYAYILGTSKPNFFPISEAGLGAKGIKWSPTGDQIVFLSIEFNPAGIWYLDLSLPEDKPRFIAEGTSTAWSPSGDQLVIGSPGESGYQNQPNDSSLFIVNLGDGTKTPIFQKTGFYSGFVEIAWSPNGRYIAFVFEYYANEDIEEQFLELYVLDTQTDKVRVLTDDSILLQGLNWSVDSTKILYLEDTTLGLATFRIHDLDGQCHQIEANYNLLLNPNLSPDGKLIAFEGAGGGIFIADVEDQLGPDFWKEGDQCN
ncbi:MAG: hypothetical protein HND51_01240 [Chloroflexi bacterium]|nr:hypothetical protein [Chloroflexota bacterium]